MSFLGSGKPSSEEEIAGVEGWKAKLQQMKEKSDQIFDTNPSGVRRRAKKNGNDKGKGDNGDGKGKNDKGKSDKGDEKGKDKSSGKNEKGKSDKGDGNKSDGKNEKGKDKKEKNDQKKDKKDKNSKEKSNKYPSTVTPPSRTLDLSLSTCDLYCDGLDAFCESAEDCCGEGFAVCDATVFDEPGYYHCGAKADYLGRCVEDEVIQHVVNAPPCELFCDGKPTSCDYGHHNCCAESDYTLCDASNLKGYTSSSDGFEENRYSCGKVSTYSKTGKCNDKPPPPTVSPTLRPSSAPPSSAPTDNPTPHPTGPTPDPTPAPTRFVMDLSQPQHAFPTLHPDAESSSSPTTHE